MNLKTSSISRGIATTGLGLLLSALPVTLAAQSPATGAAPTTQQGQSLPLSMEQAVAMALDANLGLKAERLNPDVAAHSIALAKASFLPRLQSTVGRRSSKFQPTDFTQGSNDISSAGLSASGTVSQILPWYGSNYSLTWTGNRVTQQGGFPSFNPNLGSTLQFAFTQPLMRDFKVDAERLGVETAQRRKVITDLQLEQRVVATESLVRFAYLNLVAAIEGRKVAEQNMDLAQQSLNQSKSRVAVGQSPQIEIIQAEAQVATTRERLIATEAEIGTAEDNLRALILEPTRPDFWQVRLVPTDTIQLNERPIDVDAAIKNALANRLDLAVEKRLLDITNLNLELAHNSTLPNVDLNLNYNAIGTAGTIYEYGQGFPPPVTSRTTRSYTGALGDSFGAAYPTWTLGVTVIYPLGKTAAEVNMAQSEVQKRQQEIGVQQLELQIVREVRDAARQVQNSFERVQAARVAREASEQQLNAEERRTAVGFSTTLELQVRQRDLAQSRIAELNARIAYNRALINLDRVQKTQ